MIKYSQKEMEYISRKNDVMKNLVSHFGHMERGMAGDVFSSLTMHIIGQMLSNRVAEVLCQRFLNIVGEVTPGHVAAVDVDVIKQCGISKRKAEYIKALAQEVLEGKYDFSLLENMSDEEVIKYLMQIKGVGRWTAEMIAEFTMGRLDIFSYDDVALQNGIKKAHGFKTLSRQRFEGLRKKYAPYCSVASLYYYALNDER
ncbi:MAG: DNA-3-methyladenine glycosylase 2 family protein [Lacrimispora sp.]|uniref:DNA-3-methyladenine glycosylase family protein n=1 Tax=Lacrimispora sp. TaxID=2719234 RepID=UPI0039E40432